MSINRHGSITLSKKKWHPIWDWTKREVVDCIDKAYLKPPRSTTGCRARSRAFTPAIWPIKQHAPNDYRKILEWMPLIEGEVWRYERADLTV